MFMYHKGVLIGVDESHLQLVNYFEVLQSLQMEGQLLNEACDCAC